MGGAIAEKSKDDEKKSRQEEFSKLHIKEGNWEAGEEKELLKKIREKHGFFHIRFSDREMLVRRRLREMPEEDRIPVMRMAAYLCECSPSYSFGAIHAIFSDKSNPAKHIKNLYDNARKLMDAGVDPSFACVFANGSNLQHIDDFAKVNEILKGEILKGTVQGHRLNSLSQEQIAALAETATKVGNDRIKLVVQNVEENFRMGLEMLSKLLICLHGADRETTEIWLDRLEDLRKTYEQKGSRATRKLAKTIGTWEQPSGSLRRSLKELKELMEWRKVDINIKKIEGGPEHAKELIDATVLTFRRKSSDELFKDQARLIEERGNLQGVEKKAFDIWFFFNAGAAPNSAAYLALNDPNADTIFKKLVSVFEKYGDDENTRIVCNANFENKNMLWLDNFSSTMTDWYNNKLLLSRVGFSCRSDDDLPLARRILKATEQHNHLQIEILGVISENFKGSDEKRMKFWIDRFEDLYKISDIKYPEPLKIVERVLEVVKNDEQLRTFQETFNAVKDEMLSCLSECLREGGRWKYEVFAGKDNKTLKTPSGVYIGSYHNTKVNGFLPGHLSLKENAEEMIPFGDKYELTHKIRDSSSSSERRERYEEFQRFIGYKTEEIGELVRGDQMRDSHTNYHTVYIPIYETYYSDTPEVYYETMYDKRKFFIYLNINDNFGPLFTKEFFELFIKDAPLEERLKAIREELAEFEKKFKSVERNAEILLNYQYNPHPNK
ncbi:hypothetical protein H0N98_00750 [Candidatus Micrarchaeota archaeon]|nr:hypothetical protein [Candidatus Micrarchaeota archaeon]